MLNIYKWKLNSYNGQSRLPVCITWKIGKLWLNGQLNGQLNESQRETFEYIRVNEGCNTTAIAKGLGKPFRTIDKHINILLQLGLIERRGSKRTGGYYVKWCIPNNFVIRTTIKTPRQELTFLPWVGLELLAESKGVGVILVLETLLQH